MNKTVKKILINILIVASIVFVLDFSIGNTLKHFYFKQKSGKYCNITHALEQTTADIIVCGDSRAQHHYVPSIFEDSLNMSYFNTGQDNLGAFYQLAIVKSILKRHKPKMIILDCPSDLCQDQSDYDKLSILLPYYDSHPELRDIIELKSPFEKLKLLSKIYPFNSLALKLLRNCRNKKNAKEDCKGFSPWPERKTVDIDTAVNIPYLLVDTNKVNAFKETIALAKQQNIKLFAVYSPIYVVYDRYKDFEIFEDICSNEGIPYFDYSKDRVFIGNKEYFSDVLHLNLKGATIFSKQVVDRVKTTNP